MRPKPFVPEILNGDGPYVRDLTSGLIWHRSSLRTLYVDTDRSQVVYHANYLRYFEFGRASLMRDAAYPYREIEESGYIYPIIATALATCLCCPLGLVGIVAIVFSSKVNNLLSQGDIDGARRASNNAKTWCWVATALAIIGVVFNAIYFAMGGAAAYMEMLQKYQ
mgnify:CR=1 FL=1